MIRITVEIVPHGIEEYKRTLKVAEIWNDATGTKQYGNYGYRFLTKKGTVHRKGRILNHPRLKESVWKLVQKALNQYLE